MPVPTLSTDGVGLVFGVWESEFPLAWEARLVCSYRRTDAQTNCLLPAIRIDLLLLSG